ncbi:MAG: hypothetical protein ACO3AW_05875 [Chitinophagaceae bacterium]
MIDNHFIAKGDNRHLYKPYKNSTMDGRILEMFMKENDAWDDMITRQKKEIPDLENMLTSTMKLKKQIDDETASSLNHLKKEMHNQQDFMDEIKHELAKQQRYLANEKKVKDFPINSLLMQNALRERIRIVEKKFLDLKCNYLNYLASSL